MSTPNFLQIKPNGINLPSNTGTVVASPGDMAYNSSSNQYAVYNTSADFLLTANTASSTITGLTNANLSGSAGITNANLASMAAHTVKANTTGSPATPSDAALGSLTEATSAVLTITGTNTTIGNTTIQVTQAGASTSGYLSSADWNTFHTAAAGGITALTGDVTATGPGSVPASIVATTNSTLTTLSALASVGTITTGTWNATTIAIAHGGTGQTSKTLAYDALSPTTTKGDIPVRGTSNNVRLPIGTDGQVLVANSGATNGLNWATIQAGAKNYIQYNNFENQLTTGWSTFSTTLTGVIPTGSVSAGSGAITLSASLINPLAGTASLQAATGSSLAAGQGFISQAYTIDLEDQAKPLTGKFYFNTTVGAANLNFSGTSSNSFAVYIYDTANSAWVQPAGVYGMTQSTGVGYCTYTFQTASNATSYQVAVLCINATGGATTMGFDDFFLGPQTAPLGFCGTDLVSFSPTFTGLGTVTNLDAKYQRIGDSIRIRGSATLGTPSGTTASLVLPAGFILDTTKLGSVNKQIGNYTGLFTSTTALSGANQYNPFFYDGSTNNTIFFAAQSTAGAFKKDAGSTVFGGTATGFTFEILVPISGWSSNVQMSNDTDTRVVAATCYSSSATFTPGANTQINYDTKLSDTAGAVTTGTGAWKFTAPVTGSYFITATAGYSSGAGGNLFLYKNGSQYAVLGGGSYGNTAGLSLITSSSIIVPLNAGDFIDVRPNSGATFQGGTLGNGTYISINRLSGPAVIAATESVNCSYNTATTSVGASDTTVVFTVKEFDSHNAYNSSTGIYTAPVSGKYLISTSIQDSAPARTTGQDFECKLFKNGSSFTQIGRANGTGVGSGSAALQTGGARLISLLAGETINIACFSAVSTSLDGLSGNWLSIYRQGN